MYKHISKMYDLKDMWVSWGNNAKSNYALHSFRLLNTEPIRWNHRQAAGGGSGAFCQFSSRRV